MNRFKTLKRHPAAVAIASAGLLLAASLGLIFAGRCQAVHEQATRPRRVSTAREGRRVASDKEARELQAKLDSAPCGSTVPVDTTKIFRGNFVWRKKCPDASRVTLRSSLADELAELAKQRETPWVTPADFSKMFKLVTPNTQPAFSVLLGAGGLTIVGMEATHEVFLYEVVSAPEARSDADMPSDVTIDQSYIHARDEQAEAIRGVAPQIKNFALTNSYVSGFKSKTNADTQAVCWWNTPGPTKLENNYLEAAGENVNVGGADAKIQGMVPSDITIRGNKFSKPRSWRGVWGVKNLLELKNARGVKIDGNVFEYSWSSGQAGYAIVFTPRNQEGTNPWATVENVEFTNNTVRHAASGVQLLGTDDLFPSQVMKKITIKNNLFEDINSSWGPGLANKMFLVIDGPEDVVIERNTFTGDAQAFSLSGKPALRLRVQGNAFANGTIHSDVALGQGALDKYVREAVFSGNVMAGILRPELYPAGNTYLAAPPARPPDGIGCDMDALRSAQAKNSP